MPRSSRGMTAEGVDAPSRSRDTTAPESCFVIVPLDQEGAGNTGCWPHPRALRAEKDAFCARKQRQGSRNDPAFPAQWFYGLYVVSSARRALWPPSLLAKRLARNLIPASGDRDRTISPYATMPSSTHVKRAGHPRVHRIPLPTSVTIAIRPSQRRRDGQSKSQTYEKRKTDIFRGSP